MFDVHYPFIINGLYRVIPMYDNYILEDAKNIGRHGLWIIDKAKMPESRIVMLEIVAPLTREQSADDTYPFCKNEYPMAVQLYEGPNARASTRSEYRLFVVRVIGIDWDASFSHSVRFIRLFPKTPLRKPSCYMDGVGDERPYLMFECSVPINSRKSTY